MNEGDDPKSDKPEGDDLSLPKPLAVPAEEVRALFDRLAKQIRVFGPLAQGSPRSWLWSSFGVGGTGHYPLIDFGTAYSTRVFDVKLLDIGVRLRPSAKSSAVKAVAKTVWVLWGNNHEKVWEVLLDWSCDTYTYILQEACDEIIIQGLREAHLGIDEVLKKIEGWLMDGEASHQEAAANLMESILPAMSKEHLSEVTSKWSPADVEKSLRAFSKVMLQFFRRNPVWTLSTLTQMARTRQPVYETLIADTLEKAALPGSKTRDYLHGVEKSLMALRTAVHGERTVRAVKKLAQAVRDQHSKLLNEQTQRDKSRGRNR